MGSEFVWMDGWVRLGRVGREVKGGLWHGDHKLTFPHHHLPPPPPQRKMELRSNGGSLIDKKLQ